MNALSIIHIFSMFYAGGAVLLVIWRLYGIIARRLTGKGAIFLIRHMPMLLKLSALGREKNNFTKLNQAPDSHRFGERFSKGTVKTQLKMVSDEILKDNIVTKNEQALHSEIILALFILNKNKTVKEIKSIVKKNSKYKKLTEDSLNNLHPSSPEFKEIKLNYSEIFQSTYGGFLGNVLFRTLIFGRLELYIEDLFYEFNKDIPMINDKD